MKSYQLFHDIIKTVDNQFIRLENAYCSKQNFEKKFNSLLIKFNKNNENLLELNKDFQNLIPLLTANFENNNKEEYNLSHEFNSLKSTLGFLETKLNKKIINFLKEQTIFLQENNLSHTFDKKYCHMDIKIKNQTKVILIISKNIF